MARGLPATPARSASALSTEDAVPNNADDAWSDQAPASKRARVQRLKPKKKKVRTYVRRKTEIEELTEELQRLEEQKEHYRWQDQLVKQREELARSKLANKLMHDATVAQRLSFVSSMSLLSQFFRQVDIGPFDLPTRLGTDPAQREAALVRMRLERLQVARQFMFQKHRELGTAEFYDRKKFEATNGDMVSTNFEIVPLPEASSVKAIVDALQNFVYNIEISISEAAGDTTVRENDDSTLGSPVAQHRLVTTFGNEVKIEANNVGFSEYRPTGLPGNSGHSELGMFVCDAVDEDALFPYRPLECVRQDLTVIIMITRHQREGGEPIIVLTRWCCLRIRKSEIYTPPFVIERIRSSVDSVIAAMLSTARNADRMSA